jgi:hypothetical protein
MGIALHTDIGYISFLCCCIGHAIAEVVIQHICVETQVHFGAIHVESVAYKVALNCLSCKYFDFSLPATTLPMLCIHMPSPKKCSSGLTN